MNISFFIANPNGAGVIVDNAVMFSITLEDYRHFSECEKDFVRWYLNETNKGLLVLHVNGKSTSFDSFDTTLDIPQETLCKELIRMIRAKTVPDIDIF